VNGGLAGSKIGKYAQNSGGGGNGITITDTGTLSPTPLTVSAWVEMDTFGPVLQTDQFDLQSDDRAVDDGKEIPQPPRATFKDPLERDR